MKVLKSIKENCTGCRLCEMACSFSHYQECNPNRSRIRIARDEEFGIHSIFHCVQCTEAPCIDVCPTDALRREIKTGLVLVDERLCIGCEACIEVCPMKALFLDKIQEVIIKCDLCDGEPSCVKVCARNALVLEDTLIDPTDLNI